jgi:hypothetical protein
MAISFQVMILALLIAGILGIAVGYFMAQQRVQQEAEVLQQNSQDRLREIEAAHEQRLQDALFQARQDYETQLADRIGHYQDQFSQSLTEREQEHQTRLEVWQQGATGSDQPPSAAAGTLTATAPEVLQLKHQYEARLKEAAQKLQQACEQQLAQRAKATTADLQQTYEARLAQKIAHYEAQLAERVNQLEAEFEARQAAIAAEATAKSDAAKSDDGGSDEPEPEEPSAFPQASPSEIMGTGNNEPTITLHRPFSLGSSDTAPIPEANLPDLDALDALAQAVAAQTPVSEGGSTPADLAEPQEQLLADLAELDDVSSLSAEKLDPLEDLADFSQSDQTADLEIEIEQLDPLDLDDISQLS